MSSDEEDFFSMSDNEYTIMKNRFNNPYSKYQVCRIHLDNTLNPSYTTLTIKDDEIEYKLYQSSYKQIYFKKQTPKKKS